MAAPVDIIIRTQAQLAGLARAQAALQALHTFIPRLAASLEQVARGFIRLTGQAIQNADELGKTAQKVGIAVEQLSRLAYAARQNEVGMADLQTALRAYSTELVRSGQGGRDVLEALLEQADAFAAMEDGARKTALAQEIFGRSALNLIPLLNSGRAGITELMEEADRLGLTVTGQTAAAADRFGDAVGRLRARIEGLALVVAENLLPYLDGLADVSERLSGQSALLRWLGEMTTGAGELAKWVTVIGTQLSKLPMSAMAALGSFAGGVAAGEGLRSAFRTAMEDGLEYQRLINEITIQAAGIGRNNPYAGAAGPGREGGAESPDAGPALASRADTLAAQLRQWEQLRRAQLLGAQTEREAAEITRLNYARQLETLGRLRDELNEIGVTYQTNAEGQVVLTEDSLRNQEALNELLVREAEIRRELQGLAEQDNFAARLTANLRAVGDEWGNFARNAADALTRVTTGAVDALSDGLAGLVTGTTNLAQAFQRFAQQAIADLVRMVVQALLFRAVLAPLGLGSFLPGFAAGGYTGDGPAGQVAGVVHRGELVVPAATTARLDGAQRGALVRGDLAAAARPASGRAAAGEPRQLRQTLNVLFDRAAWLAATRDDIEAIAVDAMRRHAITTGLA